MRATRAIDLIERPDGRCDLVIVTLGVSVIVELDADQAVDLARRLIDGAPPCRVLEEVA